jgi:hypothetical protein
LYQVTVTSGVIANISVANFSGSTTDVFQANAVPGGGLGAGTIPSLLATRSLDSQGGVVEFITSGVGVGQTSNVLLVSTNPTNFTSGSLSLQDAATGNFTGFAPAAAVPEFGSASLMGLMLVGFGGIYGMRRFRMPAMA